MLIVRGIGTSVVPYYLDGRDPGRWTSAAGRLLGLRGPVAPGDLEAVLEGRHPGTGCFLPRFRTPRRRPGWDLVFSAPKSVSLLSRGEASVAGDVADAHTAAVERMIGHIEDRLTVRAAAAAGPGGCQPAGGLIGACFEHRVSAANEPHLHTHVLVANLTVTARGWTAVRNDDWFVDRRALDALYQLSLRRELSARGWELEWRLHPDGRCDVAGVPTAAVRAASTQGRLVGALGRYRARELAVAQPWRERVAEAGWGPGADGRVAGGSGLVGPALDGSGPDGSGPDGSGLDGSGPDGSGLDGSGLEARVTNHLAARRSDFRTSDVIVALAACHPGGATPGQARAWAERFCAASTPVPSRTSGRRWTTGLARAADERLSGLLDDLRHRPARTGAAAGWPHAVTVLASPPGLTSLMAQAETLQRLGREWASSGIRACVAAPAGLAAARWRVLTGLPRHVPGCRADVIVVDQADRRSTAELLHLVEAARRQRADLVLVEGGTLPRLTNFASHGLADFATAAGRIRCPDPQVWAPACPDPALGRGGLMRRGGSRIGPPGAVGLAGAAPLAAPPELSGREAAGALLAEWAAGQQTDLLVGLGLEEVRALNAAARSMARLPSGERAAGAGMAGGAFQPGDRVVVVKGGDGRPPYGTFGRIVEVPPSGHRVSIRWDGADRTQTYGPQVLSGLGHGWAATAHLAARVGRPVLLLGREDDAASRLRPLIRASIGREGPDGGHQLQLGR